MAPGSKKKKKCGVKRSDPTARLTDDLLVEIISRAPYKSTCCCKCVSTRWRDLFSHPDHRKKMPQSLAGFFYQGYNRDRFPRKARYFTNVSQQFYRPGDPFIDPFIDPSLSFLPNYESLDIVDGCNGLLLCRFWKATDPKTFDYIVCNPASEKWEVVPVTDWSCKACVPRLGFDPAVSSHLHVFEFIDQNSSGIDDANVRHWEYCVERLVIYSSKAGTWKYQRAEFDSFEMPENATSTFLNGVMHLAVYDNVMVAVDVEGDNWWCVQIPMTTPDVRTGDVFRSHGQLYFANSTTGSDDTELDVWVLEDYDTSKWALKHNVSHLQLLGRKYLSYADRYSIISIHPERNLVFVVCGEEKALVSYDMDTRRRCIIRQLGWDCRPPYVSYVPLFSESLGDGL